LQALAESAGGTVPPSRLDDELTMHEIFISYRRIDTEESGGHLYDNLRDSFGRDSVFMDTRPGSIAWGADWERSLNDALNGCEALIALIGPQWATCERSPGLRRLDVPDDWVRGEIAAVLRRSKPVFPVRLRGVPAPSEDQIPDELRSLGFHKRQAYPISEGNWEADTRRLFDALATVPRLKQLHDLATTETGIRLLERLIRDNVRVADAVSRSRAVIEMTDREVDEIRLLKGVHDALHEIESKCLIPMREAATMPPLEGFHRKFAQQDRVVRASLRELATVAPELPVLLEIDLPEHLTAVVDAFERALTSRAADDLDRVVGKLEELVGEIPVRLNDAIDDAGRRLELRQLMELMATVGELLPSTAAGDTELKPMLDGIAALEALRVGLERRVSEHGLLQSLDNCLRGIVGGQHRAGTSARIGPATLLADWNHIRRLRARFKGPFSTEVEEGHHGLEALEPAIDAAVRRGDEPDAVARLNDYANEVGELFRRVDTLLKEFCFELRAKTRPLKTILDMCRVEVRHG
jgi:hypothetical protein